MTVEGIGFSRVSWSSLGSDIWDSAPTSSIPSSETSTNLRPAPFGSQVRGSLRVADDFPVGGFHAGNNEEISKGDRQRWVEREPSLESPQAHSGVSWCHSLVRDFRSVSGDSAEELFL